MKNFFIFTLLMVTLVCNGQHFVNVSIPTKEQKESDVVYVSSLRDLCGYDEYGNELDLNNVLSIYYRVDINQLDLKIGDTQVQISDKNILKEQLIRSFIQEAYGNGYEIPKIVNEDPFNRNSFILDLPIHFNKYGYIIPKHKVKSNNTHHNGHTVFDHSDMLDDE